MPVSIDDARGDRQRAGAIAQAGANRDWSGVLNLSGGPFAAEKGLIRTYGAAPAAKLSRFFQRRPCYDLNTDDLATT